MGFVQDEIVKYVQAYVDSVMDKLKYDKTIIGKVISIGEKNAQVETGGNEITCRIKADIAIAVNDVVLVKIPNNNKNLKYIDGKLL